MAKQRAAKQKKAAGRKGAAKGPGKEAGLVLSAAAAKGNYEVAVAAVAAGLGRIVALHHRSSTLHHIH